MSADTDRTIFLKDYTPSAYAIEAVSLDVRIAPERSKITAQLTVVPREGTAPGTPLVLDGEELTLTSIAIDGLPLVMSAYEASPSGLTIIEPPLRRFVLETEVVVEPEKNTRLMGLYRSNGTWCTQCESEGFRRITYFLDRPDILSTYKVTITADKTLAPVLLSNGNLVAKGDAGDNQHYAVWEDPHPKPAYLFAMVAGDLGSIHDSFTTASGRKVDLGIFCAHGKEDECLYAMDSLKRSMAWDERRFGREYDLDVFNIVAVSDFNFGAMENKGLNIFNDKLVFAKPESATDNDFANVERVIAHEYFHNWTGNRITCRDWFQLCLKEGLTVYRDQEFTSDERSRPVKRIDDVRTLRAAQFPEDGGPLAHPARPDHYKEINNFYTTTVYEKGAEIVRMLATLLGEAGFRKGMDLYFERHDGQAATIEQFLQVFADANQIDLSHFSKWYDQAGTPVVTVSDNFDEASQTYTLNLSQKTEPTPGQPDKQAMVLPIKFGLLGPNGAPMGWSKVSGGDISNDMIVLDTDSVTLRFEGVPNRPVPSLFREFSAPVKIKSNATQQDQLFLARHDSDPFNRWQALQDISLALIVAAVGGHHWTEGSIAALAKAFEDTVTHQGLDDAFKAHAMSIPSELEIARTIGKDVDPERIHQIRDDFVRDLVAKAGTTLRAVYNGIQVSEAYSPDAKQAGLRALRTAVLGLLVRGKAPGAAELAGGQYRQATNMTDRFAALAAIVASWTAEAEALLGDFRTMYTADPLVLDKWLSLNASAPDEGVVDRLKAILADPGFPRNNPNRLRALVGAFAMGNAVQFARPDGAGFRFVTEFCRGVDSRNPQVASRVLTAFRIWPSFEPKRRQEAESALKTLQSGGGLSRNLSDILGRVLAG
ncbi:MAG: pepN [Hyphomicrobiales bacterium]|nr:pepN [Hyphomicrobiales bacterium]